ncbi:MAG: PAS domain-containing protein [Anaerolineae bacterium]|nr:PAS domain-containing protein [Anaerolineae bacterium]
MIDTVRINFQEIIDTSSDGIIVVDKSGKILYANPATEELFERPSQELVESEFGFPVVEGETTELSIVRKDRNLCIVDMRVVEMKWNDDLVHLATLRDVTQRRLKEREVHQHNLELEQTIDERTHERDLYHERLNVVFNTSNDAILLLNSDGIIELANPAFARLFGHTSEEIINQPLSCLIEINHRRYIESSMKEVTATGKSFRGEVIARRQNNTTFDVEISLTSVLNNQNHMVCNLHDVSHYKVVDRMKDDFISMVNHELRTPISTALLTMELIVRYYDRLSAEKIRHTVKQSYNSIVALRELVEGILDYASAQAQRRSRDAVPFDVKLTLDRVIEELQANAVEKHQDLQACVTPKHIVIRGKDLDFTRIWRNLISNAIKYTPNEGRIAVRLANIKDSTALDSCDLIDKEKLRNALDFDNNSYLVGQVEDTGYGIAEEDFDIVFEPFNRGWAKSSNITGTGLGLSLVRELIVSYDGDICFSSQVGKGSTFTFWVPLD